MFELTAFHVRNKFVNQSTAITLIVNLVNADAVSSSSSVWIILPLFSYSAINVIQVLGRSRDCIALYKSRAETYQAQPVSAGTFMLKKMLLVIVYGFMFVKNDGLNYSGSNCKGWTFNFRWRIMFVWWADRWWCAWCVASYT